MYGGNFSKKRLKNEHCSLSHLSVFTEKKKKTPTLLLECNLEDITIKLTLKNVVKKKMCLYKYTEMCRRICDKNRYH